MNKRGKEIQLSEIATVGSDSIMQRKTSGMNATLASMR